MDERVAAPQGSAELQHEVDELEQVANKIRIFSGVPLDTAHFFGPIAAASRAARSQDLSSSSGTQYNSSR
jgi:hypothetical protein